MTTSSTFVIPQNQPMNVIIVGGSISGLTAAITFQRYGHNVTILEASHTDLEHQAAGIGTALPLQQFFDHFDRSTRPYSLPCTGIIHIDQLDRTVNRAPISMRMSSWDSLYYRLRWNFDGLRSAYEPTEPEPLPMSKGHPRGNALYRKGHRFTGLDVQGGQVTAYFEDSRGASGKLSGDILIGADGANSMVRKQMLGHDNPVRRYAGYVLWRGLVKETEVTEHTRNVFEGHFTFLALKRQYLICYPIPGEGGSLVPGERLLNFAWYTHVPEADLPSILTDVNGHRHRWSVPVGLLRPDVWDAQKRRAVHLFSPAFAELAAKIRQPFLQVVSDVLSPKAYFEGGRIILLGDAMSTLRPHSGSGASQAAAHCLAIEKVLKGEAAWDEWEKDCLNMSWLSLLGSRSWGHWYMSSGVTWGWSWIWHRLAVKWVKWRTWLLG